MISQERLEELLKIEQFKYFEAKNRGIELDDYWERINTLSTVLDDSQLYSKIEAIAQERYNSIYRNGVEALSGQIQKASVQAGFWWANKLNGDHDTRRCTFAENLASLINDKLTKIKLDPSKKIILRIACDYDPDTLLLEALNKSSIFPQGICNTCDGILPQKHVLIVYPDRLEAREGYRSWSKPIFVN